jgi:hypothetical protein
MGPTLSGGRVKPGHGAEASIIRFKRRATGITGPRAGRRGSSRQKAALAEKKPQENGDLSLRAVPFGRRRWSVWGMEALHASGFKAGKGRSQPMGERHGGHNRPKMGWGNHARICFRSSRSGGPGGWADSGFGQDDNGECFNPHFRGELNSGLSQFSDSIRRLEH